MENLINDDCFNILPNIEESLVQLLFTSVPDINDLGFDANQEQYIEFLNKALLQFCRITKDTGFIVLCQSDRKMKGKIFSKHSYIINKMEELDYVLKDYKIVVKNNIESNLLYLSQSLKRVEDQLSSKEQRYRDDFARLQQTMSSLNDQMGSLSMFLGGSGGYY